MYRSPLRFVEAERRLPLPAWAIGIVAWVMANGDLRAMQEGRMDPSGDGLTRAGKIVGMINVILSIIAIPVVIILFMIGAFAAAASSGAAGGAGP